MVTSKRTKSSHVTILILKGVGLIFYLGLLYNRSIPKVSSLLVWPIAAHLALLVYLERLLRYSYLKCGMGSIGGRVFPDIHLLSHHLYIK